MFSEKNNSLKDVWCLDTSSSCFIQKWEKQENQRNKAIICRLKSNFSTGHSGFCGRSITHQTSCSKPCTTPIRVVEASDIGSLVGKGLPSSGKYTKGIFLFWFYFFLLTLVNLQSLVLLWKEPTSIFPYSSSPCHS